MIPVKMFQAATDAAEALRRAFDSGNVEQYKQADAEYMRLTDEMWWRERTHEQRKEWSRLMTRLCE